MLRLCARHRDHVSKDVAEYLGGSALIEGRMTSVPAGLVMLRRGCAEEVAVLRYRLPLISMRFMCASNRKAELSRCSWEIHAPQAR
jgi:hypothetical protein